MMARIRLIGIWCLCCVGMSVSAHAEDQTVRVFIFAGQSNMVGSDSKADDVKRFPPFVGCEEAQPKVRFSYCLGREDKKRSDGWIDLQPVDGVVGPSGGKDALAVPGDDQVGNLAGVSDQPHDF